MSNKRIIALQAQVKIARDALQKIATGHCGRLGPESVAEDALDDMRRHDPAPTVAGLMGWDKRR